jgi:hypothetical protein
MKEVDMKFVAVAAAVALTVVGCSEEVGVSDRSSETLVLETPSGEVVVDELTTDAGERTIEARVSDRRLYIGPPMDSAAESGFSAELTDEATLLYGVSITWEVDEPGKVWIEQRTASEAMTVTVEELGGRRVETYNINGDVRRFEYPAVNPETMERAIVHARNGRPPATPELAEVVSEYADFEAFCRRHAGSDLFNNKDGELLVSILSNGAFLEETTGKKETGGPQLMPDKRADRICAVATACATFMCHFGGLANPLCTACGGVAMACWIAEIACWIFDCGW